MKMGSHNPKSGLFLQENVRVVGRGEGWIWDRKINKQVKCPLGSIFKVDVQRIVYLFRISPLDAGGTGLK